MGGRPWASDEDAIVCANATTLTSREIATLLPRRTKSAVDKRCFALGISRPTGEAEGQRRTSAWVAALEARLGESIETWLTRRYVDEQATYREIVAELGINTRTLMRLMRRCGITPISASEAVKRQLEKNPDFLAPMLAASREESRHEQAALTRQSQLRLSAGESRLWAALLDAGLSPVPQLAVGRYNIDFAFPDAMLAVEYDPCWHKTGGKLKSDTKRDAWLTARGWTILRLEARTSTGYNVRKVSDALTSLA